MKDFFRKLGILFLTMVLIFAVVLLIENKLGRTGETQTVSETIEQLKEEKEENPIEDEEEPEPEEEPEEEEEPEPVVSTVLLSAAGDCTLGNTQLQDYSGTFIQMYDEKGPSWFFDGVLPIFSEDDMTLVNFEGVLTEETAHPEKSFNMKGRPEFMQILNDGSIECVAFANNHRLDYYEAGAEDTVEGFEKYGITYAYNDNYAIYEVNGVKIGYISVNALNMTGVMDYLENGIAYLKEQEANCIIVYVHWGIEREYYANATQRDLGHKMIDMGADLVLGSHPHVLQGIEIYNGKPIVYSLGNFCFGGNRNPQEKNTMIYQQTFTFVDGVLQDDISARVIPCTLSSSDSRNDFQPTIREGERGAKILGLIQDYSNAYGTIIDAEGNISVDN